MDRRAVLQRLAALGMAIGVAPGDHGLPEPGETDKAAFTALSALRFEAGDPLTAEALENLRKAVLAIARVTFQAGMFHVEHGGGDEDTPTPDPRFQRGKAEGGDG